MIKNASEVRAAARQSLSGMWGGAVVLCLVYLLINGCVSFIPMVGSLISLLLIPMGFGYAAAFLGNARTKSPFAVGSLFEGFNDYGRIFGTMLLQGIYTILWTLLLVVPGIIKSYSYAMTVYILKDEPQLKYNAAIEKSMAMMDGHKWDLFCLQLSFIGWWILGIFTLGIGYLWLMPYITSATANFYMEVKADYEARTGVKVA
jgi:hypothetical protein bacD2_08850